MSSALSLLILLGAEAITLKEKAIVHGRWVRIIDLVDADRTDPATRARIAELYVGRAPEEGRTRLISADEIRRELQSRGIDLSAVVWNGESVEVDSSGRFRVKKQAEANMRTVTITLRGTDFGREMVEMRTWLDQHMLEPARFTYRQDREAVIIAVDFQSITTRKPLGAALAKRRK